MSQRGFYEAADYSVQREDVRSEYSLVRCWMAHHHGMSLLAATDLLLDHRMQDYFHEDAEWHLEEALVALAELDTDVLLDLKSVAVGLHLGSAGIDIDAHVMPRGYRLLSKVPRLPDTIMERIVDRFGNLQKIMRATIDDLDDVDGVGETRARAIKEGLARLAESSILDRYA